MLVSKEDNHITRTVEAGIDIALLGSSCALETHRLSFEWGITYLQLIVELMRVVDL